MQQEEKVLRVRIVGVPAEDIELLAALADLLLKAVPVGVADLELDGELGELAAPPVEARLVARPTADSIEIEHQRLARLGVAPVGIARLGEQLARLLDRSPARGPVAPLVRDRIDALLALTLPKDARRKRILRNDAAAVEEDRDEFLIVHGDGNGVPQLARALGCVSSHLPADDVVLPVEAEIQDAGVDRGAQLDAAFFHFRRQPGIALD